MDRAEAKKLREELNKVLKAFNIDYEIEVGNATYNESEVTFKVAVRKQGAETKQERDLRTHAPFYQLDVDKIATIQGKKFTLVGYSAKARKMPWLIRELGVGSDGSTYKITDEQAERFFRKEA